MIIERDLESTPLEIRSNTMLGSPDYIVVLFYSAGGDDAGGFHLFFTSTLNYLINKCTEWTILPVTPPTDQVWRITLTKTTGVRLVIHCNDVEIRNTLLSQSTCTDSSWGTYWNRDVAKIKFYKHDKASDKYRPLGN